MSQTTDPPCTFVADGMDAAYGWRPMTFIGRSRLKHRHPLTGRRMGQAVVHFEASTGAAGSE
jgi:hypothetical protein